MATTFFNSQFYLSKYPDVKAAVEAGLMSAEDHFNLFGKFEERSPNPVFDPVFYLAQNPDIATALEGSGVSAFDHFAAYGFNEARAIHPTINLGDYLSSNPDVAAAVAAGEVSAFDHLMSYGLAEPRDLGNGVNLGAFANDPVYQDALASGDLTTAAARVADVSPFLPTFNAPTNWQAPSNLPIPTDFKPLDGEKLVIPTGVKVPAGTELPDFIEPAKPVAPTPPASGGGSATYQPFMLTKGVDEFTGTAKDDHFIANEETLQTGDNLDGGTGYNKLDLLQGSFESDVKPTISNVNKIINSNIKQGYAPTYLDLSSVIPTKETEDHAKQVVWTNFSAQSISDAEQANADSSSNNFSAGYTSGSEDFIFGIYDTVKQDPTGKGLATVSFKEYTGNTLNLALADNEVGSYYKAGAAQNFKTINIDITNPNDGVIAVSKDVENIVIGKTMAVEGGNLSFLQRDFSKLKTFDASKAKGNISFGGKTGVGGEDNKLGLITDFTITGGSGDDAFDLSTVTSTGTVDGGAGTDTLKLASIGIDGLKIKNIENINFGDADTTTGASTSVNTLSFLKDNEAEIITVAGNVATNLDASALKGNNQVLDLSTATISGDVTVKLANINAAGNKDDLNRDGEGGESGKTPVGERKSDQTVKLPSLDDLAGAKLTIENMTIAATYSYTQEPVKNDVLDFSVWETNADSFAEKVTEIKITNGDFMKGDSGLQYVNMVLEFGSVEGDTGSFTLELKNIFSANVYNNMLNALDTVVIANTDAADSEEINTTGLADWLKVEENNMSQNGTLFAANKFNKSNPTDVTIDSDNDALVGLVGVLVNEGTFVFEG